MHLLSNLISNIKVANKAKFPEITAQNSKFCVNVLNMLYRLGYIRGFVLKDKKTVVILLKYKEKVPVIRDIVVVSTPGRRIFLSYKKLMSKLRKKEKGFYIISTSKGLILDYEAVEFKVGGEVLLKVS